MFNAKVKRVMAAILWGVMMLGTICASPESTEAAISTVSFKVTFGQTEARQMLGSINEFRKSKEAWYWNEDNATKTQASGLSDLKYDYSIERAAMKRAEELALSFSHTRPDGSNCFDVYSELGISYGMSAGENIAWGYPSAASAFEAWREDNENFDGQGHRRNMLSDFKSIGIGHCRLNGVDYWVQEFAGSTSNEADPGAKDSEETASCSISDLLISEVRLSYPKMSYSVKVGNTIAIPEAAGKLYTKDNASGITVMNMSVTSLESSNNDVVGITDSKLIGKKKGKATVTATGMILGKETKTAFVVNVVTDEIAPDELTAAGISSIKKSKVKIKSAKSKSKGALTVKYKKSGISGIRYQISIKKNGSSTWKSYGTSKTSKTIKGLKTNKKYKVRVRVYRDTGDKVYYGKWSKVKKVKIK